jgi:nickel/cobalt exporter
MLQNLRWIICLLPVGLYSVSAAHTFPVREIDHFSDINISRDKITLAYGVSMTEIQAVLLYFDMNTNKDSYISPQEKFNFLSGRSDEIMRGIELHLSGRRLELLNTRKFEMIKPYGMVYYYDHILEDLEPGEHDLIYLDQNDVETPGKETYRFGSGKGITLMNRSTTWRKAEITFLHQTEKMEKKHSLSEREKADRIAFYKAGLQRRAMRLYLSPSLTAVPDLSTDSIKAVEEKNRSGTYQAWNAGTSGGDSTADSSNYARVKTKIQNALQGKLTLFVIISTLALAFFIGALHALQPGHGKTLVAAYLVGSRGTIWHAILLGLVVTFTHTFSVLMLGVVVLFLSQYILPETVNMWLGIITGVLITIMGIWLFLQAYKRIILQKYGTGARAEDEHSHTHFGIRHSHLPGEHHSHIHDSHHHNHPHPHGHHHGKGVNSHDHHGHPHNHEHGHERSHEAHPVPEKTCSPPVSKNRNAQSISLWNLLTLGIVGGIVPCPDAIVLLLIAVALKRIAFGLLIITVFSAGIAVVLVTIGILMVSAKDLINKFDKGARFLARMPLVSATIITLLGLLMLYQALVSAGLL